MFVGVCGVWEAAGLKVRIVDWYSGTGCAMECFDLSVWC